MRVLRISHSAVVDEWRGRERAMRELGVHVSLMSARESVEGGSVVTLQPRPGEQVEGVGTAGRHPALFLYDPRPLWRALGNDWDVIDIHEEPFALATAEVLLLRALRRNGAPVVLYTAQNLQKRYPIPFRWLERHALRNAAGISACNTAAARIAAEKGFAGRARVIPLGIDPTRFAPSDARPSATDPGARTVTVGYLGRLVPEKGVGLLLRAVHRDQRMRLRIAGAGAEGDRLQRLAADLDLSDRVQFDGAVPPDEIVSFYRSIDVLAVPSLPTSRWTEQFGRVAVEAMSCGVPVVSSDAGALPDVVGGAGIVVPQGDVGALADALVEAAGPRAAELRAAGLVRARSCTWAAVAEDYRDLYGAVLHEPSSSFDPRIEVIVVAYGHPDMLRTALEPVAAMTVTVVDNSSMPEIASLCEELGVRYLDSGRNVGFGTAVNIALADRLLPGADVLLLNPDARVQPEDIAVLQRALRARSDLASVGPQQVDGEGSSARVEWYFPSPLNSWLEALGLARLQRGGTFVVGSVLLLRAEALDQVGGFDERFFLYAEETDWAYRAYRLGWHHRAVPGARAVHAGGGTSSDGRLREAHFHASQERYLRKHFGWAGWQGARAAAWLGAIARSAILPGARGFEARRRAALYRLGPIRIETLFTTSDAA
ncbi:glycosyltransferase [uncultured Microbacterium sp.]|uniref:glycosyltransferase n=1 Tax=uncultured Microbacterium sp. TaxID=191216 RepID=UPI0028D56533|nr:glycosyltransferase [uncultured Microbacterium sp.]